MADNVNLTAPVRANLLALQNTTDMMSKVQERLATGLKVNSAIDNPASYFTAKSLNDRAFDLSARLDGIGQGIQTLKAADKALTALDELVKNAKSLANRALDESATVTAARINGGTITTATTPSLGTTISVGTIVLKVYTDDGNTMITTIKTSASNTVQDAIDAIDDLLGVTASYDSDKKIFTIESDDDSVSKLSLSTVGNKFGSVLSLSTGSASAVETASQATLDSRKSLAEEFDQLLQQMKALVQDAGYKGVNLLKGNDLTVKFNEDGTSKLKIDGVKFDPTDSSSPIYIADATNYWKSTSDINAALDDVEDAISKIRTQASTFGSNLSVLQVREDFTSEMINALEEGAGKLVQADMNEESANMLALQTRQQLATTSLSLASQAEQSVLRLF